MVETPVYSRTSFYLEERMFDWTGIMKIPGMSALISFLLGFGIAAMFRPVCKGPDCVVIRGPPIRDIQNSVYQFGQKCVEFKTKPVECPKDGTKAVDTVSFADYE
jgi:hypothetical protein